MYYGDKRYEQYYYGVVLEYQTASRSRYDTSSGLVKPSLPADIIWQYQQLWLGLYLKYLSLSLAANKRSPLLVEHNQTSFGLAFPWIY